MTHDYHFILTIDLKEYIINFASINNMSHSKTIIYIINLMKPLINKHFLKDMRCKIGKYREIEADTDMHIYFENNEYLFLKHLKADLNIFSTAIIIRWLLEEFFIGLIKYGFKRFLEIMERYDKIHTPKNKKIWLRPKRARHMFPYITSKEHIRITYNKNYQLLAIQFP